MTHQASILLRARLGTPLADERVRSTVEATARAIAERTGVSLLAMQATDDSIELTVDGQDIVGVGFAAELRRLTDRWHTDKFGVPLWSDASHPGSP